MAGDTTAGVGGTGIKLMGGGVKSLGNAIEKSVDSSLEKSDGRGVKHATRKVAGHSVKVFSTLVKGKNKMEWGYKIGVLMLTAFHSSQDWGNHFS